MRAMRTRFVVCPVHVGRDDAIAALADSAAGVRRCGRAVLITGEAGVGKSRLAQEAVAIAERSGFLVLTSHCPQGVTVPYASLIMALRRHFRSLDSSGLEELFAGAAKFALMLLPEVAGELGVATPAEILPEDLDAAACHLFSRLSAKRLVLWLIEDLQWAGADMLRLFASLVREVADLPLWIIGTFRTDELRRGHPLARVVAELARERRYEELYLTPLAHDQVGQMLSAIFDGADVGPELVDAVFDRTGGNPFFIEEVCKVLVERGGVELAFAGFSRRVLEEIELPVTIRETLLSRLGQLDEVSARILRIAAIAGNRLDEEVVRRAAGVDAAALSRAIIDGLDEQLLVERRDGPAREYAFRHAVTREAFASDLIGPQRAEAHRLVAEALLDIHRDEPESVATLLAEHFEKAGDCERACQFALQGARRAAAMGAPGEATLRYEQTLRLCPGNAVDRLELFVEAAEVAAVPERVDSAVRLAREAHEMARARGDCVAQARAAMVLAWERWCAGDGDAAIHLYNEALSLVEGRNDRWELRALTALAHRHGYRDENVQAQEALARALRIAVQLGDLPELARLAMVRGLLADGAEVEELYQQALAQAETAGDRLTQATTLINVGWSFLIIGENDRSREALRRATEVAAEHFPHVARWAGLALAGLDAFAGEYERASEGLDRWMSSDNLARMIAADVLTELHLRRGEEGRARICADEGWEMSRTTQESLRMVPALAYLGRASLSEGLASAQPWFEQALSRAQAGTARCLHWLFTPDYARALAARGMTAELARWVDDVRQMTERTPGHRPNLASLRVCEGLHEAARGDLHSARNQLLQAADLYHSISLLPREAEARLDLARVELQLNGADACAAEAGAALSIAQRIDSRPLAAAATALLRQAGVHVRVHRRGEETRPSPLSDREQEVAVLVAQGMSNREIGQRLYLSEHTVRNHISNVLGKLELRSRTEIARWVVEQRLPEAEASLMT